MPSTAGEDEFPFPFEPYQEQRRFMKQLYTTLDRSQLAIFESPTGTGKVTPLSGSFDDDDDDDDVWWLLY